MTTLVEALAPMKTIVFAGPSLAEARLSCLSTATHAPPIKRGDLAAVGGYDVIIILDGEFGQSDSVSPKEILGLIESGKTVIGAASMGALRASELDRSGMIGVGWVYDYFRRQAVRRDADVALAYSSFDFKPMTVPMVDVEYWMERTYAAGLIDRQERRRVLSAARNIFFAERTAENLMDSMRRAVGDQVVRSVLAFSDGEIPSIKSLDAEEAVRLGVSLAVRERQESDGA
ncbi:hypothetical protein BH10PSE6_BH10PSE6_03820 [soil metagenome]